MAVVFDGFGPLAECTYANKYSFERKEKWPDTARRVAHSVMDPWLPGLAYKMEEYITARKVIPGGRYLYAAGRKYPQVNSCFLFQAEDHKEGWGNLMDKCTVSLMTGGGIGVVYSKLRGEHAPVSGMGGKSTGPIALMKMVNETARYVIQGGSRRSAIWAGLHWWHPDVFNFIKVKDWDDNIKEMKKRDFSFAAPMDMTNISVILDDDFFAAYADKGWRRSYKVGNVWHEVDYSWACDVYWAVVRHMLQTSEPGFSVNVGDNVNETLRNACTEVVSDTPDDMCNLAALNFARITSREELHDIMETTLAFLLAGTLYSKLPVANMYAVREKNRRLGLGIMGVHEWLLRRGRRYGKDDELAVWMSAYAESGFIANRIADKLGISRPVATRSIAPTGTISMVGETTSGIEPLFATAYKRRYLDGSTWKAQYTVDATAHRLISGGVDPSLIEDAYTLAEDVERRIEFQRWMQEHVDQGISSTINLPAWGTSLNNESTVTRFGNTLLKYLPYVRGITAYADGSRDGQPLTRVPYTEAISRHGVEFTDNSDSSCKSGVCAS